MAVSSRDVDKAFDKINDDIEKEIQRQLGLQASRVDSHRIAREKAQESMRRVAERGKAGDKIKVCDADKIPEGAVMLNFEEPPEMPMSPYRLVHSHNVLIEWVKELLDAAANPHVAIKVSPSPHILIGITEELLLKTYVDTLVRSAYFYTLQTSHISQCTLVVDGKEERGHLLTTLRELRQDVEAEGYDWFL